MKLEDLFIVVRELGRGGFGRVLLVRDRKTGEECAAKVLTATDADARARFVREVRQLGQYRQMRHVVRVGGAYLEAEPPFFLMPLARGGSLTKHIGKLSREAIWSVMRQLLDTLAGIHALGGVHRDVKPDNVLLIGDGTAALGDFGVGNSPHCTVHFTLSAAGTPGYAAPEIARGGAASAAADIYSAGATWYHLLTGRHPMGEPIPLNPFKHNPNAMPAEIEWVMAMTDPNPARRPTANHLLWVLGMALPTGDHPLPTSQPETSSGGAWIFGGLLLALLVYGSKE
jgi:serine/threonine protein kinase